VLLPIAFPRKKRKLLVLYRSLFASRRPLRRSFKKLQKFKPERTSERRQSKPVKLIITYNI